MNNGNRINLFNGFALDLARCCLVRAGQPLHLRPQTYDVLRYLVEHRGHLISKDKLIEEVWQGRAVTDSSLVKCIEEVREVLGPAASKYVRTVRGRGYIFDTGIEEEVSNDALTRSEQIDFVRVTVEDHEETDEVSSTALSKLPRALEAPRSSINFKKVALAAGLLVLSVAAVVAYRFFPRPVPNSAPIKSIAVLPFQNESGNPDVEYLSDGVSESLIKC